MSFSLKEFFRSKSKVIFTRLNVFVFIFSILFAISFEYGRILTKDSGLVSESLNIFNIIALFLVAFFVCKYFFVRLNNKEIKNSKKDKFVWKRFFIVFGIIFFCFFVAFLVFYPGIFKYDVYTQLNYNTTHHPLLHTYFLRFFVKIIGGKLLDNYNYGIALYTLTQSFIMAAIFSYIIERLRMVHHSRVIYIISILFCSVNPLNFLMAISATKDTLFVGFLLLTIVFFFNINSIKDKDITWREAASFIIAFSLTILLRNNMLYVAALWIPITLLILHKKKLCFYSIISFTIAVVFTASVGFITKSTSASKIEMVSIPVQTLAKTSIDHPEVVDDYANRGILSMERDRFADEVSKKYNKLLVDPIKHVFSLKNTGAFSFAKTWLVYCLKYPIETIDTWARMTVSSWYLFNTDYVNVYSGEESRGYLVTGFMSVYDDTMMNSKIPVLKDFINDLIRDGSYRSNPLLYVVMSPALYVWVVIFLFVYSLYRKRYYILSMLALLLLLFATILLGPCIIIRYMYPIMLACPMALLYMIYWRGIKMHIGS